MADWRSQIDLGALKTAPAGIIYAVVGRPYLAEALQSAATVKRWMPSTPITLFCDEPVDSPLFDQVVKIPSPQGSFEDKIIAMRCSPYERTLFLDSDTYLCDDVCELFGVLDHYDFIAALEPYHRDPFTRDNPAPEAGHDIPPSMVEHTSGVIAYRRSPLMDEFLEDWYATYVRGRAAGIMADQVTLRTCLYRSRVRIGTLPPEYNFRLPVVALAFGRIRILHGRGDLAKLERKLNGSVNEMRVSFPGIGILTKRNIVFRVARVLRRLRQWISVRRR